MHLTLPMWCILTLPITVLGYIKDNIPGIHYYENCLTWNRAGSVGHVFVINHRFTTSENYRTLMIKKKYQDKINLNYLKYIIQEKLLAIGFSYRNICGVDKIRNIEIQIPIKATDEFDLDKQKEIADKLIMLDNIKQKINQLKKEVENIEVAIENDSEFKEISLNELFDINNGNAKYSKEYINKNEGIYPVYSSQTKEDGIIGYINSYDYNKECLTWTIDGYAGTVFYRNGKFSITTHCGVLIPKKDFKDKIDLLYLSFELNRILKKYAVGTGNKRLKLFMIKNKDIVLNIPINNVGEFNLEKQKELAEKYKFVEHAKKEIVNKLNKTINTDVKIIIY